VHQVTVEVERVSTAKAAAAVVKVLLLVMGEAAKGMEAGVVMTVQVHWVVLQMKAGKAVTLPVEMVGVGRVGMEVVTEAQEVSMLMAEVVRRAPVEVVPVG
jgi:hypothetical protein